MPDPETWAQLDNSLCEIVDRLERGLRLEVEFRSLDKTAWWGGQFSFEMCLPRSYEKGVTCGASVDEDYETTGWYLDYATLRKGVINGIAT